MQHRAEWTNDGGTWGIPGGARDSDESVCSAALREAAEETSLDPSKVAIRGTYRDDHGDWSYTSVIADAPALLGTTLQRESIELRWVPEDDVAALTLHPGFATTWPRLIAPTVEVLVDVANLVGARPDGWWRDRAGASSRMLGRLAGLVGRTVALHERFVVVRGIVAVVEGAARDVVAPASVRVVRAAGSGDDALAAEAIRLAVDGELLVVTADRGLRARLPAGVRVAGPGWVRALTDEEPVATGR